MRSSVVLVLTVGSATALGLSFELPRFKNPFASRLDGASVFKASVAFRCPDRSPASILGRLEELADEADVDTAEGIAKLSCETTLQILRRRNEWIACAGTVEAFGNEDAALARYDRLALREAAKFERENPLRAPWDDEEVDESTVAVVSIVACLAGDREEEAGSTIFSGDAVALQDALEVVASAGNSEDETLAFELFWVPGEDTEVLTMDEVTLDWPELLPC